MLFQSRWAPFEFRELAAKMATKEELREVKESLEARISTVQANVERLPTAKDLKLLGQQIVIALGGMIVLGVTILAALDHVLK